MKVTASSTEAFNLVTNYCPEVVNFLGGKLTPETANIIHERISALDEVLSFVKAGETGFDAKVRELRKTNKNFEDVPTFRAERNSNKSAENPLLALLKASK